MNIYGIKYDLKEIVDDVQRLIKEVERSPFLEEDIDLFLDRLRDIHVLADREFIKLEYGRYNFRIDSEKIKAEKQGSLPLNDPLNEEKEDTTTLGD